MKIASNTGFSPEMLDVDRSLLGSAGVWNSYETSTGSKPVGYSNFCEDGVQSRLDIGILLMRICYRLLLTSASVIVIYNSLFGRHGFLL